MPEVVICYQEDRVFRVKSRYDQGIGSGFVSLVGNGVEPAQVKDIFFAGKYQPVKIPEFEHFQQPFESVITSQSVPKT